MNVFSRISTPLLAVFAMAGCANGPDDALTGTWTNTACFGAATMPDDIQSCSTSIKFDSDLTVTVVDARQSQPATLMFPRCTTTRRITGQRYSTSNGSSATRTVTLSGDSTSTVERSGCANSADDSSAAPDAVDSIPPGDMTYELRADALTVTSGPLAGSYVR